MLVYMECILLGISLIMLILGVLVGVAFLTLFERGVLGYIQLRKGPNKVGYGGILQPLSDAIKLFNKEGTLPVMSNYLAYFFSPVFSLFLSLVLWTCIPFYTGFFSFKLGILFFLCCSSLSVYMIMISGWASNSSYSLLGALRSVAQTISYEVSMSLMLISFLFIFCSLSMYDFNYIQSYYWMILLCFPLSLMFFVCMLAETNRTPFDFAEGESELVSGFNVEYSGGGFALIFLAEYSSILFMSFFFTVIFMGGLSKYFFLKFMGFVFLFLWVRGTLPRYRYDKLMSLSWKSFLPCSLNYLFLFFGFKMSGFIPLI